MILNLGCPRESWPNHIAVNLYPSLSDFTQADVDGVRAVPPCVQVQIWGGGDSYSWRGLRDRHGGH
jgi:hypothetical protein